jgi:hypothetical protein
MTCQPRQCAVPIAVALAAVLAATVLIATGHTAIVGTAALRSLLQLLGAY